MPHEWFHALLRDTPTMRNESNLPRDLIQKPGKGAASLPESLLAEVRCPVLFVWGENDSMGGPTVARPFVEQLPDADLQLWPGVGHAPWMEYPERAAAVVAGFFAH